MINIEEQLPGKKIQQNGNSIEPIDELPEILPAPHGSTIVLSTKRKIIVTIITVIVIGVVVAVVVTQLLPPTTVMSFSGTTTTISSEIATTLASIPEIEASTFLCSADSSKIQPSKVCNGDNDCDGQQDEDICIISTSGDGEGVRVYHPETDTFNYICSNSWDDTKSNTICEALGFSSAVSTATTSVSGNLVTSTTSFSSAISLTDITPSTCTGGTRVSITCAAHTSCGVTQATSRIVGGSDTPIADQPWSVAIQRRINSGAAWQHSCGGSILSTRYILSAAHCFPSVTASVYSNIQAKVGSSTPLTGGTAYSFKSIINHQSYDSDTNVADISILKVTSDISFGENAQPICLPTPRQEFADGLSVTVSGWGLLEYEGENPATLQSVDVEIISQTTCKNAHAHITSEMICAGTAGGGKDACQGDSGGPLATNFNGKWTLVGVVSFGIGCAEAEYPGVYAHVSELVNWIKRNMT